MTVYTYSQARQQLSAVLEEARRTGAVQIKRRDGQLFAIWPELPKCSPLDVPGIELGLSAEEIVGYVRESRERSVTTSPAVRGAALVQEDREPYGGDPPVRGKRRKRTGKGRRRRSPNGSDRS